VVDLLLLRHGESEWNVLGRWQGHADSELSAFGRLQAEHAAEHHAPLDRIVSSDLRRAAETADIIAARWGIDGVGRDGRLRERAAGPWEGCTRAEIEEAWPGWLEAGKHPPGWEEDDVVLARVDQALVELVTAGGGSILVVSHGGVLRALERRADVDQGRIPNLGGRWWRWTGAGFEPGDTVVLVDADEITRPEET
jgi:broad specificity phosphatase PhoE